MTEQTREAVDSYIGAANKKPGSSSSAAVAVGIDLSRCDSSPTSLPMDRQHWVGPEFLRDALTAPNQSDPHLPPHRQLRAVPLLLGHKKIESTVRYLGIEVDDALAIAEQIDV
jgi:hypothetical protein